MSLTSSVLKRGAAAGVAHTAVVCGTQRWSYGDLIARSARSAAALAANGVKRGDRVAIMMRNRPEYLSTLFGCSQLGAVAATMNPDFRASELQYILRKAQPACIVADRPGAGVLQAVMAGSPAERCPILELEESGQELIAGESFETAMRRAGEAPCEDAGDDEPVLIVYTSGSTAQPKGVLSTHGAEAWSAAAHRDVWKIGPFDSALVALPLSWAYGLSTVTLSCLSAGAKVVLLPRFRPDAALQAIGEERTTLFFGVTTMFVMLANYGRASGAIPDLTCVRFALSSGERRDEEAFAWFRQATGAAVSDAYASSEVRPVITYDPLVDPVPRPGSCGRLVRGVEARLLDPEGKDVPDGEAGELWLRSRGMFTEYFRQPELTAERRDAENWFRTGDLLRRDVDGYWYFVGRATDVIRRGGANVSPAEVVNALVSHPTVRDVAVVGVPDPVYGETVGALVVGDFMSDEEARNELRRFAARALAEWKLPTVVRVAREIPKGPTGKADLRAVAELLCADREGV